jgi:hypothetical protein
MTRQINIHFRAEEEPYFNELQKLAQESGLPAGALARQVLIDILDDEAQIDGRSVALDVTIARVMLLSASNFRPLVIANVLNIPLETAQRIINIGMGQYGLGSKRDAA